MSFKCKRCGEKVVRIRDIFGFATEDRKCSGCGTLYMRVDWSKAKHPNEIPNPLVTSFLEILSGE